MEWNGMEWNGMEWNKEGMEWKKEWKKEWKEGRNGRMEEWNGSDVIVTCPFDPVDAEGPG